MFYGTAVVSGSEVHGAETLEQRKSFLEHAHDSPRNLEPVLIRGSDQFHNGVHGDPRTVAQLTYLSSILQNHDAVADTHDLLKIRRDEHDRHTLIGEFGYSALNLDLGRDIDTLRRLIENQHARLCG